MQPSARPCCHYSMLALDRFSEAAQRSSLTQSTLPTQICIHSWQYHDNSVIAIASDCGVTDTRHIPQKTCPATGQRVEFRQRWVEITTNGPIGRLVFSMRFGSSAPLAKHHTEYKASKRGIICQETFWCEASCARACSPDTA